MRNFTVIYVLLFVSLFSIKRVSAQLNISKPDVSSFTQACASPSFNTYNTSFSFSGASLNSDNQFIIELSDATGNFSSAEEIRTTNPGEFTTSPVILNFMVPTTVAGEGYRIRIKSTSPAGSSIGSNDFPAYFKIQDEPFTINNLIETASYCSGGSYLLTIDNPGVPPNNSPLQYDSLTFEWRRETSPTESVFVAVGETLAVSTPGTYFVITDYGSCTSNSFSNRVTVSESAGTNATTINSSLGNPFCVGDGSTTLSTTNGDSYQWFKDGEEIEGAINQELVTNESGNYEVLVDFGSCSATGSIDLNANGFTSSINVSETEVNQIEEGSNIDVIVTTTADTPEFKWFFNDTLIAGANSNTFQANQAGDYRVEISQTVGCMSTFLINFQTSFAIEQFPDVDNIPNLVSPNADGFNDNWILPRDYVSGTNTEILILTSKGETVLKTNDYQNNWPESSPVDFISVNPIYYYVITTSDNKTKQGSITIIK
ncbi:gliding motility-associated C-terminal domain-containing protein [uncultured Algibacter sp.]|uniref:T9SS type B sorting domain-containing protein n=1 Tax=uncultured Algibacter sp. TaxID=298659 RepID=UPI0032170B2B